jgi:RNA polymerase sigma-70 factor (ECF subfamily)
MRAEFDELTQPHRRELLAYCYRMSGSVHDAEELVQETLLRAWRAADRYDPNRASVRTWLYRIATNVCLTALESRPRRPLPAGLVGRSDDPFAPLSPSTEIAWLEPFPDARSGDPAVLIENRDTLRLAFVAALQLLSARQRAVLILRDALQWSAAQTADALDLTVTAVNSGLRRARSKLTAESVSAPATSAQADRSVLDAYVSAFQQGDLGTLVALLRHDVILEMPPVALWYRGVADYRSFMSRIYVLRGSLWRVVPVGANGQPAFAAYSRDVDGGFRAHSLQVLTIEDGLISHNVVFADAGLLRFFDLPDRLPA